MAQAKTVVVGGGTGFIGTALTNTLRKKGYDVIKITRKPGLWCMTWSDLEKSGLPPCKAVVNLAGQNVLDPTRRWTPGFKQNVYASRINTTKSLAKAITDMKEPPNLFATISGVGFYEPSDTEEYTETSAGGNTDFFSKLCKDWEDAGELRTTSGVRRVVVRSGVVLGRNGGMIKNIFVPFYLGVGGPVGSGTQFMPWIHIHDIVGIFIYAIENNNVIGTLNGVAPEVVTNGEFCRVFAKALWRPAVIPLPAFVLNVAFSEERATMLTRGQKVLPKRTQELGYKYQYPDIVSACKEVARLFYPPDKSTFA